MNWVIVPSAAHLGQLVVHQQGVETGACPQTAVREDPSMNLAAVGEMEERFPARDVVLIDLPLSRVPA